MTEKQKYFDVLFPLPSFDIEIKIEEWEKYRRNDRSLNLIKIFQDKIISLTKKGLIYHNIDAELYLEKIESMYLITSRQAAAIAIQTAIAIATKE